MSAELGRRVAFTLGALLVFRIGTYIPLPGLETAVWAQLFGSGRLLRQFDTMGGGAIARMSIFALGITPYISAAVLIQVIGLFFRRYRALLNTGYAGRRRIQTVTRAVTLVFALIQSYGVASALTGIDGLVAWSPALFIVAATLTLTASSLFLMWLVDQITDRGIGNGIALFLTLGILMSLPRGIAQALELGRQGYISPNLMAGLALFTILLVVVVVLMERARRRLAVTYRAGGREIDSRLDLKLNGAGIVPALLATWVLGLPLILSIVVPLVFNTDRAWGEKLRLALQQGQPLHMFCFAVLAFFFVYLYTGFVVDPTEAAEKLARHGGAIPQVAPGEPTADHIDTVVSRVTFIGAIYFVVICLIPDLLIYRFDLPFYLGGTSLLILVCTVVDIEKQVRAFAPLR